MLAAAFGLPGPAVADDSTPPTVTIAAPLNDSAFVRLQHVEADFSCADEEGGSGVATCVGDVEDGVLIDTTELGEHFFDVTATDAAGNVVTQTVVYNVLKPLPPLLCAERKPTIYVRPGQGLVRGTKGSDVILGSSTSDRIDGRGGRDLICGGAGNDRLVGGSSHDTILGGIGNDALGGGTGNDRLFGERGNDRLGLPGEGRGEDALFGGPGRDAIRSAGDYKDKVSCGSGRDAVFADPFDRLAACEDVRLFTLPPPPLL
jgi:Ca2+-binding RTX toxin-like protein